MNPLILLGAAAAGLLLASKKASTSPPSLVTGKSGQPYAVRLVESSGDTKVYDVFAPAGSVGNPADLYILTYQQTGSDMAHRPMLKGGKAAAGPLLNQAITDFGLQAPAGVVPLV